MDISKKEANWMELDKDWRENHMDKDRSMDRTHHPRAGIFATTVRKAKALKVLELRELVHELNSYRLALETQGEEMLRSQNQLSSSEKKYHELFDLAPASRLILSKIGLVQEVNQSCAKMLGTMKSNMINKPFLRYTAPEYLDIFHEHVRKVLKTKSRQTCKLKLINRTKSPLYVQMESVYIKTPDNNRGQINTSMIDITEHKETDKSLTRYCDSLEDIIKKRTKDLQKSREQLQNQTSRQSEDNKKNYRLISRLTSDCIFRMIFEPGGQILMDWATKPFYEITGYSFSRNKDPLILEKIVDTNDISKLYEFLKSAAAGAAQSIKLSIRTRQGEKKWVSICANSEQDDSKPETLGVIGVIKDISRICSAELEIIKKTSELQQSKNEIELSSSYTSHDLKAYVRAVTSFSETLLKKYGERLDKDGHQLLLNIHTSSSQMKQALNEILTLFRASSQPLDVSTLEMEGIIRDSFGELNKQQPSKSLKLRMNKIDPCQGDLAMMNQVISGIFSNIIKSEKTRDGAEIDAGSTLINDRIIYYIKDSRAELNFSQANTRAAASRKLHSQGPDMPGIKMAIVRRIIQRHDGNSWTRSYASKGTAFYFSLPVVNSTVD